MFNQQKVIQVLRKLFFWLPKRFHAKRDEFIRLFIGGMDLFRSQPLKLLGALGFTILGVILDGLYFGSSSELSVWRIPLPWCCLATR